MIRKLIDLYRAHFNQTVIGKIVSFLKTFTQINSSDIAVSEQSFRRLMNITDDSNAAFSNTYSKSTFDLWDKNFDLDCHDSHVISYLTINKKYLSIKSIDLHCATAISVYALNALLFCASVNVMKNS